MGLESLGEWMGMGVKGDHRPDTDGVQTSRGSGDGERRVVCEGEERGCTRFNDNCGRGTSEDCEEENERVVCDESTYPGCVYCRGCRWLVDGKCTKSPQGLLQCED